jgi:hypothetical protein
MNRTDVLNSLDHLTRPGRHLLVHADLLHHEINRVLLDLGLDTVGRDELHELLHGDLDYHDVLDDHGRVVWKGLGLRSYKVEDVPTVYDAADVTSVAHEESTPSPHIDSWLREAAFVPS